MIKEFMDDGAGGNLYEYSKSDILNDYNLLIPIFGPDDPLVKDFKKVLDFKEVKEKEEIK